MNTVGMQDNKIEMIKATFSDKIFSLITPKRFNMEKITSTKAIIALIITHIQAASLVLDQSRMAKNAEKAPKTRRHMV